MSICKLNINDTHTILRKNQHHSVRNFKISKYIIFHLFLQLMTRHGQASGCPVKMTDSLLVKQTGTLGRHISCMQKRLMLMHAHA